MFGGGKRQQAREDPKAAHRRAQEAKEMAALSTLLNDQRSKVRSKLDTYRSHKAHKYIPYAYTGSTILTLGAMSMAIKYKFPVVGNYPALAAVLAGYYLGPTMKEAGDRWFVAQAIAQIEISKHEMSQASADWSPKMKDEVEKEARQMDKTAEELVGSQMLAMVTNNMPVEMHVDDILAAVERKKQGRA